MPISNIPLLRHRDTVSTLGDQDDFVTKYEATNDHLSQVFVSEMNATIADMNAKVSSASSSASSASSSALAAQASANFKGYWNSETDYTVGQSVLGGDNAFYVALLNSTNQNPTNASGYWKVNVPIGAIGNINSPLLDMPLKNSLAMKAGVGSVTFTRASTATYIDRYGVLKSASINEPRFEKEGYLNESASTNLLTYSEQFDNAYWYKEASTLTANTTDTLDPYGTNLADKIMETAVTSSHALYTSGSISFTAGVSYTQSWFIKQNGRTKFRVTSWTGAAFTTSRSILIDLVAKTSTVIEGTVLSHGIIELENGWFRVWFSATADATGTQFGAMLRPRFDDGSTEGYLGDVTKGFYIFGAQLEALPFATSYIPTVASAVTRSSDILKAQFENNSIGYKNRFSEETISIDIIPFPNAGIKYIFTTQLLNPHYRIFALDNNNFVGQFGESATQLSSGVLQSYAKYRVTLTHDVLGITRLYVNGIQKQSGTSGTLNPTTGIPTGLYFGSDGNGGQVFSGRISNIRIWDKALTAQEVALA